MLAAVVFVLATVELTVVVVVAALLQPAIVSRRPIPPIDARQRPIFRPSGITDVAAPFRRRRLANPSRPLVSRKTACADGIERCR